MHVFYTPDIDTCDELPPDEAAHCLRVLRLSAGDEVMLTDGRGTMRRAVIASTEGKHCRVEVTETIPRPPLWTGHLHVAVAPTKNIDRMEWLAEKVTEIGIDELTFLDCRYSERRVVKTERVEKVVVSAVKQSLKARMPRVNDIIPFRRFIDETTATQRFIAHCREGEKTLLRDAFRPGEDTVVLIGPEGDFSDEEVAYALQAGFRPVSLGPSRLRTETAALVALHTMNLLSQTT